MDLYFSGGAPAADSGGVRKKGSTADGGAGSACTSGTEQCGAADAGCCGYFCAAGEAADAAEAQNLRVACWGDDLGLIASRLKDFEAAHPELTVETVQYASETEFLTAMGAGKLPDVIWCGYDRSRLELLAAKGYLAELDGLVDSLCAESAYFENVLRLGALSGHVYFLTPGFTLTAFSRAGARA